MESALVTLALLACPVGMGLMMWFMGKGMMRKDGEGDASGTAPTPAQPRSVEQLREEQARLAAEIERRERELAPGERSIAEADR